MSASFRERYENAARRHQSFLCIGLDPDPARLPAGTSVVSFLGAIIEATADLACCYKPNAAFFEADGAEGWAALRAVIDAVPEGIPVLLDAKRGDIGDTTRAYARAAFDSLGADAITASPYLGRDALEPFLAYEDRHTFVLCRTSNPGAGAVQELTLSDGVPLYEHIASLAREWNTRGNVGLVVGATRPEQAARVRARCPDQLLLLPGIGAQGGDLDAAVRAALDARGGGILVNASRSILYASDGPGFAAAARAAAQATRDAINLATAAALAG